MGFYQTQSCLSRPVRAASPVRKKTADTPVFRNDQLENRLIAAETLTNLPSNISRVRLEFAYDYMSRRVSKQVSNIVSGQWSVVSIHAFVYDGWNLVSKICNQESQITTNRYVWGLDLSGSLQGAGGIGGLLAAQIGTNQVAYTYDANGNVSELISASGTMVGHYEYSPFGETIVATGQLAKDNKFRFSTKYTDDETGLNYYGYRYFSPSLGRWLSRDPLGELGGYNLYAVLNNGPINKQDAIGLVDCGAVAAAKAAIEAAERNLLGIQAIIGNILGALNDPRIPADARPRLLQALAQARAALPSAEATLASATATLTAALTAPSVLACCCIAGSGPLCGYVIGNIPTGDGKDVWDWVANYFWVPILDWLNSP